MRHQEQLDELLKDRKLTNQAVKQCTTVVSELEVNVSPLSYKSEQGADVNNENALDKVLTLLEKSKERALVCNTQSVWVSWSKQTGHRIWECKVCQSSEHSTTAHCRMYKLCFKCFADGHVSYNCDKTMSRASRRDEVIRQGN